MAHKQILIMTSLVLTLAMVHESRAQNCGCGVGYGRPIYGVPTSYAQSYYDPCAPTSWGWGVSAGRGWRGRHRPATVTYGYTPQVYAAAPTYRRFGPLPPPQFAAKPPMKQPLAPPDGGASINGPAAVPRDITAIVEPPTSGEDKVTLPPPVAPPTPPALQPMIETAQNLGNLTRLLELADLAKLLDEAKVGGPYTVLAPDDEAFARLPADQLQQLKANRNLLRQVVLHHVISDAKLSVADLVARQTFQPLTGPELRITKEGEAVRVDDAQISRRDIECVGVMIHVIDRVLIPPDVLSTLAEGKR